MYPLARILRRHLSTTTASAARRLNPDPKTLSSLYHEPNLDVFLSRLHRLSSSSPAPLPASIYAVASRRLAAAGRPLDAALLLDSLASRLHRADLISLYGKAGLPDHALRAFHDPESPPTLRSFNSLLSALDPAAVVRHFDAVPPEINPDVASYSTLLHALCLLGDVDEALRRLNSMEENGVPPNDVSFNTILNALYKRDRADEAEAIWKQMEEKGCGPNVGSYNAKMRWLVSKGRTGEAVELFDRLESSGVVPDGYSISALIVGHCKDGNLKQGKRLLGELRKRKLEPTPWIYDALLPKMCEVKEFDSAISLCYESIKKRCYVGVEILQGVVNVLASASRVSDARKLVETCWARHYSRESLVMPQECLALIEAETQGKMLKEMREKEDGAKGSLLLREAEITKGEVKSGGEFAKIGIIVKSFDKPKYAGAFGVPPDKNRVKLPTTRTLITVLRSPHIDKKSREQFEMKVRREYITVKCQPHELHKKYFWFKRTRILGAQFELVFSYKTRLDMTRLKQSI